MLGTNMKKCFDPTCIWCKDKPEPTMPPISFKDMNNKLREKDDPGYLEDARAEELYGLPVRFEVLENASDVRRGYGCVWPDGTVDYRRLDGVASHFITKVEFLRWLRKAGLFTRLRYIDKGEEQKATEKNTASEPSNTEAKAPKPSRSRDLLAIKNCMEGAATLAITGFMLGKSKLETAEKALDLSDAAGRLYDDGVKGAAVYRD
ncbi:hypothetical protein [Longispora urticae]